MAEQLKKLNVGDVVDQWKIRKLLGEGGFGAVYEVINAKTQLSYAMKTEMISEALKVLKMEVYVMRQANNIKAKHIVICEDTGSFTDFLYVVMTMVGKSLQDVRKMCPGQKFSLGTALSIGIQSLEAIEELHMIGFLHRDIKPSNFAIGRPEINELRKLYLLDFGMCRRYMDDNKQIRRPRAIAGFRGTIRYAPLSCHIRRETSRKDDIESWFYQQVEITRGALPWRSLEEKNEVAMFKERCRYGHCLYEMMGGCPRQYIEILKYVDSLRYYDTPDYNKIYKLLRTAMKLFKVVEFPYDWEAVLEKDVQKPAEHGAAAPPASDAPAVPTAAAPAKT